MKRNLNEQLKRIHNLTYGKNLIKEDFLDDLFKKINSPTSKPEVKKIDDPKKADFVSKDVKEFYDTLDSIDQPIFQQNKGSMSYQKEVETVQIGLLLLGYDLPKHGVDGLFGPETAAAVNKFKSDNKLTDDGILNEAVFMAPVPIPNQINHPFGEKRSYETHPGVDLGVPSGTNIKAPADGVVKTANSNLNSKCGGTIDIDYGNGFWSRFCHVKTINVNVGDVVKKGQIVGLTGGASNDTGRGNSKGPHLHFTLKKDGRLVDPMDYVGKEVGSYDFTQTGTQSTLVKAYISPEMIDLMIDKLKQIGVKPEIGRAHV